MTASKYELYQLERIQWIDMFSDTNMNSNPSMLFQTFCPVLTPVFAEIALLDITLKHHLE